MFSLESSYIVFTVVTAAEVNSTRNYTITSTPIRIYSLRTLSTAHFVALYYCSRVKTLNFDSFPSFLAISQQS